MTTRRLRIWIDISNTPHVLFFEPIIRELERLGHRVAVTSRRFANTVALAQTRGLRARRIGAGHDASRNALLKQARHVERTARLMAFARQGFDVAASHLSFTQAAAARRLGIPTFGTMDYEHTTAESFRHARCLMVPAVLSPAATARFGVPAEIIRRYDGLKEDVYLANFQPTPGVRERLGVGARQVLVTFRPIADHARYNDDRGQPLQERLLRALAAERDVCVLILPRTAAQASAFAPLARELPAVRVLRDAVDGPSLICASDLVVCGGGTMLREAAVLGVPAVSVFAGPLGEIDQWLANQDRALLVRSDDDVRRIRLERRRPGATPRTASPVALQQLVRGICDTAEAR